MTPCSWITVKEQRLQRPGESGEQGPQTSAVKITDPWGNTSLLIKGGNGVLEYSSWLNWQSWSLSAMGLGWWMVCLLSLISQCCLVQAEL